MGPASPSWFQWHLPLYRWTLSLMFSQKLLLCPPCRSFVWLVGFAWKAVCVITLLLRSIRKGKTPPNTSFPPIRVLQKSAYRLWSQSLQTDGPLAQHLNVILNNCHFRRSFTNKCITQNKQSTYGSYGLLMEPPLLTLSFLCSSHTLLCSSYYLFLRT